MRRPGGADAPGIASVAAPRLGRTLAELAGAILIAAVVSGVLQFAASRIHVVPGTNYVRQALTTLAVAVVIAALVFVMRRVRRFEALTMPALLAALTSLGLSLPLLGTRLYLGGVSIDQAFRTEYVTRLASSPALADMTYRNLASYYPAGWFWLAGRFAALTGMPAWAAYKPFAILTLSVLGAVSFVLWKLALPHRHAAPAALGTTLAGLWVGAPEPYGWISASLLAPIAVLAYRLLRSRRFHTAGLISVGVFLGVSTLTYTLYSMFFVLLVVTFAAIAAVTEIRAGSASWSAAVARGIGRLATIGAVTAVIGSLFWAQYLVGVLTKTGPSSSAAQRYLPAESTILPTPMLEATAFGALCLIGAVWLLASFRRNVVAAALGTTAALVYVWFGLSTLALFAHTTLLAFRLTIVLDGVLAAAGVLGAIAGYRLLHERLHARHRPQLHTAAIGVALIGAIAIAQAVPQTYSDAIKRADSDAYPTGLNARGQSDPSEPGAWTGKLTQAIGDLSHRKPTDLVLLTTDTTLLSFEPYWSFQAETPHYANPLANYPHRMDEITGWASARTPAALTKDLDQCRDTPPTVFVLEHKPDGLHMTLHTDVFPSQPNVAGHDVVFAPSAFAGPAFSSREVGPYTVIVRNP